MKTSNAETMDFLTSYEADSFFSRLTHLCVIGQKICEDETCKIRFFQNHHPALIKAITPLGEEVSPPTDFDFEALDNTGHKGLDFVSSACAVIRSLKVYLENSGVGQSDEELKNDSVVKVAISRLYRLTEV
jgi:hypothetical protein